MLFVQALQDKFPIWADRQRNRQREKDINSRPSLEDLIADIQDEARRTATTSMSDTTKALHISGKDRDNSSKRCDTCHSKYHVTKDCLHNNYERRKAWEDKTGKKWLTKEEYNKVKSMNSSLSDSQDISNKKVNLYSMVFKNFPVLSNQSKLSPSLVNFLPRILTNKEPAILAKDKWLADSGADTMVTNQLSDLTNYQNDPIEIEGAGGRTISPGFGSVELKVVLTNGTTREIILDYVRYMPQCPVKLFSLKKIMKNGGSLHYNRIMFVDEGKTIELCETNSAGFLVESKHRHTDTHFKALVSAAPNASLDTWHRRLAHAGTTNVIRTKNMVHGIDIHTSIESTPFFCDACELGTPLERKRKFVKNKSTNALSCIHLDTFQLSPESYHGHKYGLILTDEATSEKWGYTFNKKNIAFDCLREFTNFAQKQWGDYRQIKAWRMDGGKEYAPSRFNEMCIELGQKIEISTPYAPWQDGRAERSIRTIIEKVRKSMIAMEIPSYLWPHIFSACIYITNRTATSTLNGLTPIEAFLNQVDPEYKEYQSHKPDLSHLRVLGCKAYVLIPEEKRLKSRKLDPRAELGIFVGYEGDNIYKVWIPSEKGGRLVRSSNVRFDESNNTITYHQNRGDQLHHEQQTGIPDDSRYFGDMQQTISTHYHPNQQKELTESHSETLEEQYTSSESVDGGADENRLHNEINDSNEAEEEEVDEQGKDQAFEVNESADGVIPQDIAQDNLQIEEPQPPPRRYSTRGANAKPSRKQAENEANSGNNSKYGAYPAAYAAYYLAGSEISVDPQTYKEAMSRAEANQWRSAIFKEYSQLQSKKTWSLCKRSSISSDLRPLTGKLVFKTKRDKNGNILKYKARWVVRGFEQKEGIDFNQTFASTCSSTTWKLAIALAAKNSLEIHQMDVVAAFLQGDIDGDIYVELPPEWTEILNIQNNGDNGDNICKLNKALYGLKQSPRLWQQKLKAVLSKLNFIPLLADEAAYISTRKEEAIIIITHVDDFLIISKPSSYLDEFKEKISNELDIEDLGHAQYFLGVRIIRNIDGSIYLCQDAYINKVLSTFGMESCYIEKTPMEE
ncbi:hypothetical protein K3495_g13695, partial [Podosphaera aphanis]